MSAQEERDPLTRPEDARSANDRIADRAARYHFVSRVPMLCECSESGCDAIFLIELDRYRELRGQGYFTAPEHTVGGASPVARDDDYWLHR
jgi:hypothetical protein